MTTFVVEELPEQPYVAVVGHVTMQTIPEIADRFGEVFGFLAERGVAPAGSPFFRYRVIDMARELVMEAAVPVAAPVEGAGEVIADSVPAGRYVTTTYVGHPDELEGVTRDLLAWADGQGLTFDHHDTEAGDAWAARVEFYDTDPVVEPAMEKWQTRLAFKLVD